MSRNLWAALTLAALLLAPAAGWAQPRNTSGAYGRPAQKTDAQKEFDRQRAAEQRHRQQQQAAEKAKEQSGEQSKKSAQTAQPALPPVIFNASGEAVEPFELKATVDDFPSWVFEHFIKYYERGIAEKLYLQTDKPYYVAGDTVWLKGYLLNAITNSEAVGTHYIYVELLDRRDTVLQRIKIRKSDPGGYHNCLPLDPQLPEGDYALRAYTQWMRNAGPDYFFRQQMRIGNPVDDLVSQQVAFSTIDGVKYAVIRLLDRSGDPIQATRVNYSAPGLRPSSMRTDNDGTIRIPLDAIPDASFVDLSLDVANTLVSRTVNLPSQSSDFEVQFFPEGGDLIASGLQVVAFKAIGRDGLSREVKGGIYNAQGEEVAEISTLHKGMGRFTLIPTPGESYTAKLTCKDVTKTFSLPAAVSSGVSLRIIQFKGRAMYQISATPDIDVSKLGLVVQQRGRVVAGEPVIPGKLSKAISLEGLPSGIMQFAVVDKQSSEVLSQRLVFVRGNDIAAGSIRPDKQKYNARGKVNLDVEIKDGGGNPAAGNFSLSVTDRNSVHLDRNRDNILSNLLLTSDLKGHIEEPGYYFESPDADVDDCLDLLMLTQGWTRFDVGAILRQEYAPIRFRHEDSQSISGEIRGFFGNAARDPYILILSPTTGYLDRFQVTGTHKFNFVGLEFPDSTTFVLQSMTRGGNNKTTTLKINPDTFPRGDVGLAMVRRAAQEIPDYFLRQSKERYYYEGGMRVIDIDAVTVKSQRPQNPAVQNIYGTNPTHSLDQETISRFQGSTIFMLIGMLPGVQVSGTSVSIRGSHDAPLYYVDNIGVDSSYIEMISPNDIEQIDLVSGPEAGIFGLGASGGVILIYLKSGANVSASPPLPSIATVTPLGYKKPAAFYQPAYDVPEVYKQPKPDLRTTIYWDPEVRTDSLGRARVSFFAADRPADYDVILEGVTEKGSLCRATATVVRE